MHKPLLAAFTNTGYLRIFWYNAYYARIVCTGRCDGEECSSENCLCRKPYRTSVSLCALPACFLLTVLPYTLCQLWAFCMANLLFKKILSLKNAFPVRSSVVSFQYGKLCVQRKTLVTKSSRFLTWFVFLWKTLIINRTFSVSLKVRWIFSPMKETHIILARKVIRFQEEYFGRKILKKAKLMLRYTVVLRNTVISSVEPSKRCGMLALHATVFCNFSLWHDLFTHSSWER